MRIAALQMATVAGDPDANLARIAGGAGDAAARGADLLITPELAVPGYGAGETIRRLAEPADGPAVTRLKAIAAETGVAIIAGLAEAFEGGIWNSAAFINPRGETTIYRKSHLYGDYERNLFRAEAPSAVTVEHAGHRLGMGIVVRVLNDVTHRSGRCLPGRGKGHHRDQTNFTLGSPDLPYTFRLVVKPNDQSKAVVMLHNAVYANLYGGTMPARVGFKPAGDVATIAFQWE